MPDPKISKQWQDILFKAIDRGLSILGDESVKRAFYYHMEKRTKMKPEDIPENLALFHRVLVELFFDGAPIIERRIARNLYEILEIEPGALEDLDLTNYAKAAERSWTEKRNNQQGLKIQEARLCTSYDNDVPFRIRLHL